MKLDNSKAQYVDLAQIIGTRVEKIPNTLRLLSENHQGFLVAKLGHFNIRSPKPKRGDDIGIITV